ncbi:hypothetical protein K525DRAFT_262672, partial [Schizophyllum commune Loenen D]
GARPLLADSGCHLVAFGQCSTTVCPVKHRFSPTSLHFGCLGHHIIARHGPYCSAEETGLECSLTYFRACLMFAALRVRRGRTRPMSSGPGTV